MQALALEADADLVARLEARFGRRHDSDRCLAFPLTLPFPVRGEGERKNRVNHLLIADTLDRRDMGDGVCLGPIDQVKIIRAHAEQDFAC